MIGIPCKHRYATNGCRTCAAVLKSSAFQKRWHVSAEFLEGYQECAPCAKKVAGRSRALPDALTVVPTIPKTLEWACAVTSCAHVDKTAKVPQRGDALLPATLANLEKAGFPPPWLFVDGASCADAYKGSRVAGITVRSTPARVHGNWFLSLHELWVRRPLADRYAVFQDDVVFLRDVRLFLETSAYPDRGYLNLYTEANELYYATQGRSDRRGWVKSTQRGKGALALVFDRPAVEALLVSRHMVMRPVPDQGSKPDVEACRSGEWYRGQKAVDGGIVESMRKAGISEYIHLPTLCQHTGHVSSFSIIRHPDASGFLGEDFDAVSLDQS